jgi:hypothetical protein
MEYGFLQYGVENEQYEHTSKTTVGCSMTILVMLETLCRSVWAYALEGKGEASVDWAAAQIRDDLTTVGLSEERIITKSGQGNSIVQLQHEIAKRREGYGSAVENSKV